MHLPDGCRHLLDRLHDVREATEFLTRFDGFIYDYGSRGPNEWEMRCPTWETNPELALVAIDRMRVSDATGDPRRHQERLAQEAEALAADVLPKLEAAPEVQGQLAAALNAAKVFMPGRERTKTTIIKGTQEVRLASREIGRRMVEVGVFEKPEDIGMLRDDELDAFGPDEPQGRQRGGDQPANLLIGQLEHGIQIALEMST